MHICHRDTSSCTKVVLWGETKKCKCFLALRKSYCGHPGIKAGWAGGELRIIETRDSPEAEGGRRTRRRKRRRTKAAACLLSSQPIKPADTGMARSKSTLCAWLGCPGLLGCFLLGFLAGEYRDPGAQPVAFALCRYCCASPDVTDTPSGSFYCFLSVL